MKDHDSNATDPRDPADPVNRDSVSDSWGRAAAYDAYADGLHTYALGGLRHHEAASSAVYCAFVAADHHVAHLGDAEMLRPWLYAITRHYCRAGKLPRLRLTASSAPVPAPKDAAMAELERTLLSAELASLDWPDTDGLSAAHREVLELSVRHGMESRAVGMMLGKPAAESFEVLSGAWHELERSLAALALLRTSRSHCPDLAALAEGWSGRLTAQRREPLVAHVDACSRCQYHLHKVIGAPQAPSILPHVPAPKELRERVLGDLLDSSPEKAAEKTAIATRLTRFDQSGFPAIATMRLPASPQQQSQPHPRTATPMPVERRQRRLGALLAGRVSSAAAEAVAGEVASAPERLRTPVSASVDAKTPANTMNEGSGFDASDLSAMDAGSDRRRRLRRAAEASAEPDEGPIAPRRGLAASTEPQWRGGAADGDPLGGLAGDLPRNEMVPGTGSHAEEPLTASQSTEVLAALRSEDRSENRSEDSSVDRGALRPEDLDASFGPRRPSSCEDTLITAGVFEDIRPARPVPSRGPAPRNSVAAAVEGRRRGVEDARRGAAPVGDAYEAAASVAAAMAAGNAGAQVPPIAPVGVMPTSVMPLGVMPGRRLPPDRDMDRDMDRGGDRDATRVFARPVGAGPEQRRRKSGVKSAIASSAVLSGVGAAGVTAFVLFVPSSPSGNKTLFTPPDAGGSASQTPDYPRPSSTSDAAGPALPVAGGVHSTGLPGDTVTAQVVAAVLPTTPSSSAPSTAGASLPFNGPVNPLPSQSGDSPSQDPSQDGQLHISVTQRSNDPSDVVVTLWNSGTSPVSWTASPDQPWLSLSATSGMLAGGGQTSIHVLVDASAEPSGAWTAHVRFDPSGQMVSINGVGGSGGGPSSTPSTSPSSGPTTPSSPSSPSSSSPSGTPSGTPTSPVSTPSTPHSSPSSSVSGSGASSGSASGPGSPGSPGSLGSEPSHGPSSPSTPGSSGSSASSSSSAPSTAPSTGPTKPTRHRH
ncbi:DNA-directed RNA polymerase specialized sigma24 family protein [Catenulispora sp. GAS73]|uniref:BACON domain-containing protein n=1 Tax=Catenulispora sp. GAS73 TaxID=3156269 RepID=UPI003513BBAD